MHDHREDLDRLSADGHQRTAAGLAAAQGQRDLSPRRRAWFAYSSDFPMNLNETTQDPDFREDGRDREQAECSDIRAISWQPQRIRRWPLSRFPATTRSSAPPASRPCYMAATPSMRCRSWRPRGQLPDSARRAGQAFEAQIERARRQADRGEGQQRPLRPQCRAEQVSRIDKESIEENSWPGYAWCGDGEQRFASRLFS